MKTKILCCLILFNFSLLANAENLSGEAILKKLDGNIWSQSLSYRAKMRIHNRKRVDEKEMLGYTKGKEKSFTEFLNPARDKGTKFLKIGDKLWMYLPSVEKVISISGHMLTKPMMGSDLSYEDMLERSQKLTELYDCQLIGEEKFGEYDCYVLELTAKKRKVTYHRQKLWVLKDKFIAVKEELYAKSGMLMRELIVEKIEQFKDRYYPTHVTMMNKLRKGTKTEVILTELNFDAKIKETIFSKRNLRR